MPHAASLQSFLDTCSQGHFDNSSNWLPQHPHCRHVVPQEHTGRHIAPNDPGVASCFPRSHKPLWLHVAGDSTMRFFYAGLLSYFNGTERRAPGFPLHWLPSNDSCAFAKTGWPTTRNGGCRRHQRLPFVRRVTGPKADFPGASYEAQVVGRGNALLDAYARNQSGGGPVLFVNRPVGADCRRRGGGGRAGDDRESVLPLPPVRRADRRERVLGTEGGARARARAGDEVVVVGTIGSTR